MSAPLTGLVVSVIAAAALFAIALLIRIRGPVGLVKNVDWSRVSDRDGFGQYASLVMICMSSLVAAHGFLLYAFAADHPIRSAGSIVFVVLMALLAVAMLIGQLRYQDRHPVAPRRDLSDRSEDGRR